MTRDDDLGAWLDKHPRFKMHLTPTSSSWLNLVERFFADLTGDVIRAGSFASVNELVRDSLPCWRQKPRWRRARSPIAAGDAA